jgi:outer membrane protein OmpA-like peptidoglycan-associated protein
MRRSFGQPRGEFWGWRQVRGLGFLRGRRFLPWGGLRGWKGDRTAGGSLLLAVIFSAALAPGLQASREPVVPAGSLGAAAAAQGGAQVAQPGAAEGLFVNPAALAQVRWVEAGAGLGQEDLGGLRESYLAAALPLFGSVTAGAGALQAVFPRGPQVETDLAYAALAFPLTRGHQLLTGINVKYFFHAETPSAAGLTASRGGGVDLGFLYKILSDHEGPSLQLGLAVSDPQTILKNEVDEIQLPVLVRAGLWWRLAAGTSAGAQFDSQSASAPGYDTFQVVRAGAEHRLELSAQDFLALRLGYFQRLDQTGAATGGVGLVYGDWSLDYALQLPVGLRNALHEVSLSWGPQRRTRASAAPREEEPAAARPKPTATPQPQDRFFSALDLAAEVEEERRRPEPTATPTPAPKSAPGPRVVGDLEAAPAAEGTYHLAVPQSPADQESAGIAPEVDMPGSFSGYLSGLKTGPDNNFRIVNQDLRLMAVVNPFSPNHDGRQDKTIFVGRLESERIHMSHWVLNIVKGDRVFKTFRGGSGLPRNLEWDGTDAQGRVLPDGTYDALLRIFDAAGLEAAGVSQPVEIRTQLVPIKLLAPAALTLTGDKQQDQPLLVSVPKLPHSSRWGFVITDPARRKVFEQAGSGEVPEKISWPPRVKGRAASAGTYRGTLEYLDEVGLKGTAEIEFKVGYAAFALGLKAAPLLFNPGQGAGQGVTFSPELQGDLKISRWTLTVLEGQAGREWRKLAGEGAPPAAIFWDGQDGSGQPVPGGKMFRGILSAVSALGTEAQAESALLQADLGTYTGKQALAMNLTRVLFEPGSAALSGAAVKNLQAAIAVLQQNKTDFALRVLGHCTLSESRDKPIELSRQRAQNVADYLIKEGQIPADKIQSAGYGANQPLTTSAGETEDAKNRRVEIVLFAK